MKNILYLSLFASSLFSMQQLQLSRIQSEKLQAKLAVIRSPQINTVECGNKIRIQTPAVIVPSQLGLLELYHDSKGFCVYQQDKKHRIDKCFTDSIVRDANREQLKTFLQSGYLTINKTMSGEFSIKAIERVKGGGPLFGKFMYWVTKTLCYSTIVAATGAIIVGGGSVGVSVGGGTQAAVWTGKALKAARDAKKFSDVATAVTQNSFAGIALYQGGAATVTGLSGAVFSPAAIGVGMGAAASGGAGLVAAGYGGECAAITGSAIATGASSMGIVAGIEFLSLSVGLFFGMTPTL